MKKILGISLVALFAVAPFAADATLTSKGYVDGQLGLKQDANTAVKHTASTAVGSATQPVYIDTDGTAKAITSYEGNAATATKATADASGNTITDTYQRIDNMVTVGSETGDDANKYPSVQKVEDMMSAFSGDVTSLQADIELFGDMLDGKVNVAQGTPNAKKIAGTKSDGTVVFATPTVSGDGNVVSSVSVSDAGALTLNKDVTALTAITTGTATGSGTVVKGVSASGSTVTATMGTIGDADVAADAGIAQSKISGLTDALDAKAAAADLTNEVNRATGVEAGLQSAIDAINAEGTGILAQAKTDATAKANTAEENAKTYANGLKTTLEASLGALAHLEIPASCNASGSNCVLVYRGSQGFVLEDIERATDEIVSGQVELGTLPKQSQQL